MTINTRARAATQDVFRAIGAVPDTYDVLSAYDVLSNYVPEQAEVTESLVLRVFTTPEVLGKVMGDSKINAIKAARLAFGIGLKEAKDLIEDTRLDQVRGVLKHDDTFNTSEQQLIADVFHRIGGLGPHRETVNSVLRKVEAKGIEARGNAHPDNPIQHDYNMTVRDTMLSNPWDQDDTGEPPF